MMRGMAANQRCVECGVELPPGGKRGPGRRYCSTRCRVAAHRDRVEPVDVSGFTYGPPPPLEPPAPVGTNPEERLAVLLLDARGVAGRLSGVAPALPRELRWRAQRAATEFTATLDSCFPIDLEDPA